MKTILCAAAATALLSAPAMAAGFRADIAPLNDADASATAVMELTGMMLNLSITGSGFAPDQVHIAHIHGHAGLVNGAPAPSVSPILPDFDKDAADAGIDAMAPNRFANDGVGGNPSAFANDGDGVTELFEAAPFYGGILVTLDDGSGGLLADAAGNISFLDVMIDLTGTDVINSIYGLADREIVIHGVLTTDAPLDLIAPGLGGGQWTDPPEDGAQAQAIGRSRGGPTTKIHGLTDACGRLVAFSATPGNMADISAAPAPLAAMPHPRRLIADRGYDANSLRRALAAAETEAVIPSTRSRKKAIPYDRAAYRDRNRIERAFGRLKDWRRVATRYDRCPKVFLSAIALAAAVIYWL